MAHAASGFFGEQKRRSTRIGETVSLAVRGVDLLGQPFEERTSTLVLNLHGCKYASKHHLPKNTWLTLELADPESESGRRCVRARVAWIQKPRTLRELFQIGVELETPENIWGVAIPPEDWQTSAADAISFVPAPESSSARTREPGGEKSASVISLPTGLSSYMERVLTDASGIGGPGGHHEGSPLLLELRRQLERQATEIVEQAAARAGEQIQQTADQFEQERRATSESFYERWKEEFERARASASSRLSAEIETHVSSGVERVQETTREAITRRIEAGLGSVEDALRHLDEHAKVIRGEMESAANDAHTLLAKLKSECEMAEAAEHLRRESLQAELPQQAVLAEWRTALEREMSVAREQWHELLQSSIDGAVEPLAARLGEASEASAATAEKRLSERIRNLGDPFSRMATEARQSLAGVQSSLEVELNRANGSLAEIEQAANRISEYSAQLEAASQDAVNELHRRLESTLAAQTTELNRRGDTLAADFAGRLRSELDKAREEAVARAAGETESRIAPAIERVRESLRQLTAREAQVEESLRLHRERLRQASELNLREANAQMSATLDRLRGEFEEARGVALAKWNEEIEASGVRATHAALDSVSRTLEAAQQQARAATQSAFDEALQKANQILNERSEALAEQFGSRVRDEREKQLEESRGGLAAISEEALAIARKQLELSAHDSLGRVREGLETVSVEFHQKFSDASNAVLTEKSRQLEETSEEKRKIFEASAAQTLDRFQTRLEERVRGAAGDAQGKFAAQLAAAMQSFRAQISSYENEWRTSLERVEGESLATYEERLRGARESWLATASRDLDQRGEAATASLVEAAEHAVRRSCTEIFDSLAQTIREKILPAASDSGAAAAAAGGLASAGSHAQERKTHSHKS
ncbi:MAG: hypothetical protein ACRD50_09880 [Candidatus Acidiferrales bacterium]